MAVLPPAGDEGPEGQCPQGSAHRPPSLHPQTQMQLTWGHVPGNPMQSWMRTHPCRGALLYWRPGKRLPRSPYPPEVDSPQISLPSPTRLTTEKALTVTPTPGHSPLRSSSPGASGWPTDSPRSPFVRQLLLSPTLTCRDLSGPFSSLAQHPGPQSTAIPTTQEVSPTLHGQAWSHRGHDPNDPWYNFELVATC